MLYSTNKWIFTHQISIGIGNIILSISGLPDNYIALVVGGNYPNYIILKKTQRHQRGFITGNNSTVIFTGCIIMIISAFIYNFEVISQNILFIKLHFDDFILIR